MKKILFFVFITVLLVACNQENSSESYAMIVVVNNTEYNGAEANLTDYEEDEVIGKISKKVSVEVFPDNNQSNFFEEGSIIYSVKDNSKYIIVIDKKGERSLLQKSPGNN